MAPYVANDLPLLVMVAFLKEIQLVFKVECFQISGGINRSSWRSSYRRGARSQRNKYGSDFGGTSYEEFEQKQNVSLRLTGYDPGESSDFGLENQGYTGSSSQLETSLMDNVGAHGYNNMGTLPLPSRGGDAPNHRGRPASGLVYRSQAAAYQDAHVLSSQQPNIIGMGALSIFPILKPLNQPQTQSQAAPSTHPLNVSNSPLSKPQQQPNYNLPDEFWEFPREKLAMRQKIGEGVMGEVWRARADGICGRPGQTVVAVKMLKGKSLHFHAIQCTNYDSYISVWYMIQYL